MIRKKMTKDPIMLDSFVQVMQANVHNEKLTAEQFRKLVSDSVEILEGS